MRALLSTQTFNSIVLAAKANFSFSGLNYYTPNHVSALSHETKAVLFTSDNVVGDGDSKLLYSETTNTPRFSRFSNPVVSYDFKCGHYIGI